MKITLGSCFDYMTWLDPLGAALDAAPGPVPCFFRDDDAGWADGRLLDLIALFEELGLPLDLAVIPAALGSEMARELRSRLELGDGTFSVHQHGFAHIDHEPEGQKAEPCAPGRAGRFGKCEFGPARPRADQLRDIADGQARLARMLGPLVEPIFTPPWNRCTRDTGRCLAELGFATLSREVRAEPLGIPGLSELPIHVDWLKRRHGERIAPAAVAGIAAAAVSAAGPVGVMLHHAEMDAADRDLAAELLALLAGHERSRCVRMRDARSDARGFSAHRVG